jgi:cytochrome c556
MSDLEDYYDDLEEAVEIQNWEKIKAYAMQMKNTSPVILTGKRREELPHDFVMLDTKYHLHTLALVEAAETREMVKLNIEYDNVKQTCDDCHQKYKKKES